MSNPNDILPIEFSGGPMTVAEKNFQALRNRPVKLVPSLEQGTEIQTTASGAPTTGTWALDDIWVDVDHVVWRCTVAGTPGTWVQFSVAGLSGLTTNYYPKWDGSAFVDSVVQESGSDFVVSQFPIQASGFISNIHFVNLTSNGEALQVQGSYDDKVISSDDADPNNRVFSLLDGEIEGRNVTLIWRGANAGKMVSSANAILSADWVPLEGHVLRVRWNDTDNKWCEQWRYPSAGGVTGLANPSASVGLTAVNGAATTAMRSDGAPALSPALRAPGDLFNAMHFR